MITVVSVHRHPGGSTVDTGIQVSQGAVDTTVEVWGTVRVTTTITDHLNQGDGSVGDSHTGNSTTTVPTILAK